MKITLLSIAFLATLHLACAPATTTQTVRGPGASPPGALVGPNVLQSLHVRLEVDPEDGSVEYLGWYDGRRNLLGPSGIIVEVVGIQQPEFKAGRLQRVADNELAFAGVDQNQIAWVKRYRLDGNTVSVTYRVTNNRDQVFDAIICYLADMPESRITGDNRDLHVEAPGISAHFHAVIDDPNFPGEQMNLYAMRSDSRRLRPGDSMEFKSTWELTPKFRQ